MKSAVKLHPYTYNLLIERDFDLFSSTHLRDALLKISDEYLHVTEATKFVRRQLHRLETLGFIHKIEDNSGRSKVLYKKTESFYSTTFIAGKIPKNSCLKVVTEKMKSPVQDDDVFLANLNHEKVIHEAKLAVVLSEIEEYKSLMHRFPYRKKELMDFYEQAKNHSAKLLGRVTALSKVLGLRTEGQSTC